MDENELDYNELIDYIEDVDDVKALFDQLIAFNIKLDNLMHTLDEIIAVLPLLDRRLIVVELQISRIEAFLNLDSDEGMVFN